MTDARVTLVDAAGNVIATPRTGLDGAYAFSDLDIGGYAVTPMPTAITAYQRQQPRPGTRRGRVGLGHRRGRPRHRTRPRERVGGGVVGRTGRAA
ncbi:hypothetical protein [Streptomyces sp. NPDC008137]|uniref:hypothetical protein n=1 Tax=Streptomyces sp. NPDC008137 TaxID=3364813 RepID=UPI0036EC24F0